MILWTSSGKSCSVYHNLIEFSDVTERIVGGEIRTALGAYADLLSTSIVLAMSFLIVAFLHRKRIYLRL